MSFTPVGAKKCKGGTKGLFVQPAACSRWSADIVVRGTAI